jgi:hypothetical protein
MSFGSIAFACQWLKARSMCAICMPCFYGEQSCLCALRAIPGATKRYSCAELRQSESILRLAVLYAVTLHDALHRTVRQQFVHRSLQSRRQIAAFRLDSEAEGPLPHLQYRLWW